MVMHQRLIRKALSVHLRSFFLCISLCLSIIALIILFSAERVYSLDLTLAWDENTEADLAGYRIYCREEGEDYNYALPAWEGTDSNCTIHDLEEDVNYYFVARAFDESGHESTNSNEVSLAGIFSIGMNENGSGGGCFIHSAADVMFKRYISRDP